jgi:glycosyltransferase involved in cell wall biosynthesis
VKPTVYLINLSFALAGIERRFANIWRVLRDRANVRPILVVPDTLARSLRKAKLLDAGDELVWPVEESRWLRSTGHLNASPLFATARAALRSRAIAGKFDVVWDRIRHDSNAVIHIGLNCSALTPPHAPLVYECVDSTLTQLGTRHYVRAARRPCIVHCQTDRIRRALEETMAKRSPVWTTVTSPCYFASYADINGIRRDPQLIAFVGRLSAEKNPVLFLEAIARVRAAGFDCRALILGEGPLAAAVDTRVRELGLGSVIESGFVHNPLERLKSSAVYVTLQTGDNYGSQSLLEAMGAGCAVVATDVGETRRIVNDSVGLLVREDAGHLADALISLLRDPPGTAALGAAASRYVRAEHSADRYVAFLESLYSRAVDKLNRWDSRKHTNAES